MQWNLIMIDWESNSDWIEYDSGYGRVCIEYLVHLSWSAESDQGLGLSFHKGNLIGHTNCLTVNFQVKYQYEKLWQKSFVRLWLFTLGYFPLQTKCHLYPEPGDEEAIKSLHWLLPILTCQNFDWPVITCRGLGFI